LIFPLVDAFIVHNKRNKKDLSKIYQINEKKIFITTHGVFNLIKNKDLSSIQARKHLGLPYNKKILLFFGYIRPYKGIDILIKAFSRITNKVDNILLLIVGQPWNDNWTKYEKLITRKNLNNKINTDIGFVPESEINYYFYASDLVIFPYKHLDTHGGVPAIAIAYKKPLIVTDVGGLPEFVKDKIAIVKPNNPQILAERIIHIINDEKLRKKLSKDSEKLISELNWDTIAKKTVKIYLNIINN
jgi:glycosyltransferase involved in cell wall biosynthesis